MRPARLNLPLIEASLRELQARFDQVNSGLRVPRDFMTEEARDNLIAGYRFVDHLLAEDHDPFRLGNSQSLLELNTLVLCGNNPPRRRQYASHIAATEERFYNKEGAGITAVVEWLQKHQGADARRRAAGVYVQIVSRPELYIEGNHRTGALVMSWMLARQGLPPFILSLDNAGPYFEVSGTAKEILKRSLRMLLMRPVLIRRLAGLLEEHSDPRYLVPARARETCPL